MSILTPPARRIDPRGQRFGAGVSAVVLAAAFLLALPALALLVGLNLAISAAFGTRLFLPGPRLALRPPRAPPRAAGRARARVPAPLRAGPRAPAFIGFGAVAFALGATPLGWLLVGAVAGLQVLLATTGICVGCRLYVLRWWVPSLVARLFRRTDQLAGLAVAGAHPLHRPLMRRRP